MKLGISLIALALITCTSCQSMHKQQPDTRVTHVVLLWLKTPGDQAAAEKLIEATHELGKIQGMESVYAGRPLPSTRPVVDSSYDVGIMFRFTDEQALRAYEVNPKHVKVVNEILLPLTAKQLVYDIRDGVHPAMPK